MGRLQRLVGQTRRTAAAGRAAVRLVWPTREDLASLLALGYPRPEWLLRPEQIPTLSPQLPSRSYSTVPTIRSWDASCSWRKSTSTHSRYTASRSAFCSHCTRHRCFQHCLQRPLVILNARCCPTRAGLSSRQTATRPLVGEDLPSNERRTQA